MIVDDWSSIEYPECEDCIQNECFGQAPNPLATNHWRHYDNLGTQTRSVKVSHGKKKWIVAYDGTIKRSNDRTKKDYWKDLKTWAPVSNKYYSRQKHATFCPQCKHVAKDIVRQDEEHNAMWKAIRAEYEAKYGEAERAWRRYRIGGWKLKNGSLDWSTLNPPRVPEPITFWEFQKTKETKPKWVYHDRTYLCFKCERKWEMQREMWFGPMPGKKKGRTWAVKHNRRQYRSEINNLLRRGKYDEEAFDDIGPYKHDWLD
jgi:hypothetical protein